MDRVNFTNGFVIFFVVCATLHFLINHILEFADYKTRRHNGGKIPDLLKNIEAAKCFDEAKLKNIMAYENDNYRVWFIQSFIDIAVTMFIMLSGVLPAAFNFITRFTGYPNNFWSMYFCMFILMMALSIFEGIFDLPFDLYDEFHIEKKYGFSQMTVKLWLLDSIKSIAISIIMTAILLFAIVGVLYNFKTTWWILVTCVLIAFILILQVLYPIVLAPIFNKFTPLEDGELKTKITDLMQKAGFKCSGIFTVDESKRSKHSNAYFTGLGKSKRVVLYDTLIAQLSTDELVAVLGHEFGHYKLGHITRRIITMIPLVFVMMFILFKIAQSLLLYTGFGFAFTADQIPNVQFVGFLLVNLVLKDATALFSPIQNYFSRRDEYAADKFSKDLTGSGEPLITSLIKLDSENLKELVPSKIYAFWHYSHPTLLERIAALRK